MSFSFENDSTTTKTAGTRVKHTATASTDYEKRYRDRPHAPVGKDLVGPAEGIHPIHSCIAHPNAFRMRSAPTTLKASSMTKEADTTSTKAVMAAAFKSKNVNTCW